MARPRKKGLDYFPLDVEIDDNLELIQAEFGLEGFAIVIRLWQKIYQNGYFIHWGNDEETLFSSRNNTEKNIVNAVINRCFLRNIFNEIMFIEHGILTSSGIQRRYSEICKLLRRKNSKILPKFNLINGQKTVNSTKTGVIAEETKVITEETKVNPIDKYTKEKKRKEIKEKENIIKEKLSEKFEISDDFVEIVNFWFNYKKERKESYKSDTSKKVFVSKLKKLSGENSETAKEIIERSVANNWAGIFPLEKKENTGATQITRNKEFTKF